MASVKVKPRTLLKIVEEFSEMSILVIGDIILDSYIWGDVDRICPEAPVPVVNVKRESSMLGGSANVAVNLKTLGCEVALSGVVGRDGHQEEIFKHLKQKGILAEGVITDIKRPTTRKTRVVAGHQQVVRFDYETRVEMTDITNKKMFQYIKKNWDTFDAVIVSDYGKGVISRALLEMLHALHDKSPKILSIDPKERNMAYYKNVSLITPNKFSSPSLHKLDAPVSNSENSGSFFLIRIYLLRRLQLPPQ